MGIVLPVYLALALSAIAGLLFANELVQRTRTGTPIRQRRPIDRSVESWSNEVRRRLPAAFDAQQVAKAGYLREGKRPRPAIAGPGKPAPAGFGWQWRLNLPGASAAADWDASRIVGAINTGDQIGAVAELHQTAPGFATLSIWKRDPLTSPQPIAWRPGEQPSCCKPGTVCIGRQRDGQHIHFDIINDTGALASLIVGRRGSGKSETMRLMLAQMLAWGWVDATVIDLVRQGVDFAVFEPLLPLGSVITDPDTAKAAIVEHRAEAKRRSEQLKAQGKQKVLRYSREVPLLPIVIDEVHALSDDSNTKLELRRLVQETRNSGVAPVLATQHPIDSNLDTTLTLQISNKWCGRVGSPNASYVVFGDADFPGRRPHELVEGKGSAVCDVDGPELLEGRTWHATEQWHADHVGALLKRRVVVG